MSSIPGLPWEDLALVLAALRTGSLNRAAVALGVSQSTASRRLVRAEERLRNRLFDRTPEGLVPTAFATEIAAHAELIESHMADIEHLVAGREGEPTGRVRIALPDGLASNWLIPSIAPFLDVHPGIELDLVIGHAVVDLVRREADLALRFVRPTSPDLVVARIGEIPMGPFVHPSLADRDPRTLRWMVFDDPDRKYLETQWVDTHIDPRHTFRVSLWNALFAGITEGVGAGLVSPLVAVPAGLVELPGLPPVASRPLFLVYHRALRDVPRIAALRRWLTRHSTALLSV